MALSLSQVATALNTLCAVGASLQAAGVLNGLSPTLLVVATALLAALNAVAHSLAPAPAPAAPSDAPKA